MIAVRLNAQEIAADSHSAEWRDETTPDVELARAVVACDSDDLSRVRSALDADGAVIVDVSTIRAKPAALLQVLDAIGRPIRVFKRQGFWRSIGVDLLKDPARSEGIGDGPLHMDFVNASKPPDYVCLYCERSDPLGGGASLLSALAPAIETLTSDDREALLSTRFTDGRVDDLLNIGSDINPFPLLEPDVEWPLRYTASMKPVNSSPKVAAAKSRLDQSLRANATRFHIPTGSALIFDNRRLVHARCGLGDGQEGLHPGDRRLLIQAFASRDRSERKTNG